MRIFCRSISLEFLKALATPEYCFKDQSEAETPG
jgi:hypothetical protein